MKILLPVYFHSAMGGLHLHIIASVRYLRKQGHEVTVVCKPGPFSEEIQSLGGEVIETDYTNQDVHRVIDEVLPQSFDVVYAHPFDSRQLGLAIAEAKNIPFVLVIHGMYHDEIAQYHERISKVIAVSETIGDYLIEHCPDVASKIEVIFNGVSDSFRPGAVREDPGRLTGMFISRIDADMLFNLDVFWDALQDDAVKRLPIDWVVVGDGTQRGKYEIRYADELKATSQTITWTGWLSQEALPIQMQQADFIIAPSRAAIEALAVGKPTIAAGSKGYHGLITPDTWKEAAKTNFGGIGSRYEGYQKGEIGRDIIRLTDPKVRKELGEFSSELANREFRDNKPQRQLEHLLQSVIREGTTPINMNASYPHVRYEQLHFHRSAQLLRGKLEKQNTKRERAIEERDEARKEVKRGEQNLIAINHSNRKKDQELEKLRAQLKERQEAYRRLLQQFNKEQAEAKQRPNE